jgi:hypothetical protein
LLDKALRAPAMIGDALPQGKRKAWPLHVDCCGRMKKPYNSLASKPRHDPASAVSFLPIQSVVL